MSTTWKKRAAVGVVAGFVIACGAGDDMAGELLEDAGQILVDAGQAMADAGSRGGGDASAQVQQPKSETKDVACTDALVRTVTVAGTVTRTITRLAEVTTSPDGITGIDVIVCGREGEYAAETCGPDDTCEGSSVIPAGDCRVVAPIIEGGKVRAWCGTFTETGGVAEPTMPRWRTARITIRR